MNKISKALAVAAVAVSAAYMPAANAVPVKLELALLMDVSGSVDASEYALQKGGYVNAFKSQGIKDLIVAATGGIAVSLIQWSGAAQQFVSVGWTHLQTAQDSVDFADAIDAAARSFSPGGQTAPGSAINFAAPLFTANGFEGGRLVIDVSGDGSQNQGVDTAGARDAALAGGGGQDAINAINGLPILGSEAGLDTWYQDNIVGGPGSFNLPADSFAKFDEAVAKKIGIEIQGTPEPGSLALAGLALAGVAGLRRRQRS